MRTTSNHSKLMKIITIPIRVLKKGRDLYVRNMMDYAQKPRHATSSNMMGSMKKGQPVSGLPKSFSTSVASSRSSNYNYENEDLRELIRANSTSSNNNMGVDVVELCFKQIIEEQQMRQLQESMDQNNFSNSKSTEGVVPRSFSVGMGRIDEDKACDFAEEEKEEEDNRANVNGVMKNDVMYPRSRSQAVGQTSTIGDTSMGGQKFMTFLPQNRVPCFR